MIKIILSGCCGKMGRTVTSIVYTSTYLHISVFINLTLMPTFWFINYFATLIFDNI